MRSSQQVRPAERRVQPWAIVTALLLAAGLTAVSPYLLLVRGLTDFTRNYLPIGALVLLIVGTQLVAPLVDRFAKRVGWGRRELLLIYCIVAATVAIGGNGAMWYLIPVIATPAYYASPMNHWQDLFMGYIKPFYTVNDPFAVKHLFEGIAPGQPIPWRAWIGPLTAWGVLLSLYFFALVCLAGIFRTRWVEEEKLTYPLAQVPLGVAGFETGLTALRVPLFRSKLMWMGFLIPVIIHSVNSINKFWPAFPALKLSGIPIGTSFVQEPFNVMHDLRIHISFGTIGIGYMMPRDVSLGFVFFFWWQFVQRMILRSLGFRSGAMNDWNTGMNMQLGAYVAFAVFLAYASRSDLRSMVRAVTSLVRGQSQAQSHPDRWMLAGFVASVIGICAWSVAAGMSVGWALAFFGFIFVIMLSFSFTVSSSGMPVLQTDNRPQDLLVKLAGVPAIGPANLTVMAFQERSLTYAHQSAPMPVICQAFKICHFTGIPMRTLVGTMMGALVIVIVTSVLVSMPTIYYNSGIKLSPKWFFGHANRVPFDVLVSRLGNPLPANRIEQAQILAGGAVMWAMMAARRAFLWWPVHPLGFLVAYGWQITAVWFSTFTGWVITSVVNRYGGAKLYWRLRPIFLGMILGECCAAGLWIIIDLVAGISSHSIPLFI